MKFLTDYELEHMEHKCLRLKYRELQREIERLTNKRCDCTLSGITCDACQSDAQALEDTQKRVAKSTERDKAEGINGY